MKISLALNNCMLFCIFFCFASTNIVEAKSTNMFPLGEYVKNPNSFKTLSMSRPEIYKRTMGIPSKKALLKSQGNFEKYYASRRPSTVTGKAFEARTAVRINRALANSGSGERIIISAVEKLPNDVSDLIRIGPDGQILERYQLKTGGKLKSGAKGNNAIKALFDPKYKDMTVVCPPDELKAIKEQLKTVKEQVGQVGKELPDKWQKVEQSIHQGRLTDKIAGRQVPTTSQVEASGKWYLGDVYQNELHATGFEPIPASNKTVSAIKRGSFKAARFAGPVFVIVAGGVDIATGIYTLKDAEERMLLGHLDQDIYRGKQVVGTTQIGLGTVTVIGGTVVFLNKAGVALLIAPEPFYTKVAAIAVLTASVGLVAADYTLERVQGKRLESRRNLLRSIDEKTRQRILIDQLQEMAKSPAVPAI